MTAYRLLGPFEALVPLPGGKPRALLARLLLDAGHVVSAPTLVDELWEQPPRSAPKVLQAHVSALRKALGAEAIETRAAGYRAVGATTDLARFEELAEQARREPNAPRRSALLRDALSLWRGPALAEFRREPFAHLAGARLEELRLTVLERRLETDLELGDHEQLVPELRALVAAEPLREPFRRQLMLALYGSGRQADALAVYREGRRVLVGELGVEPSRELQALEGAILRQDPSLARPPAAARRGPVVCEGVAPLALLAPVDRELLVVELASDAALLPEATERLRQLGPGVRTACFTSTDPTGDLVRLVREQAAELLVVARAPQELLAAAPCDVALLTEPRPFAPEGPVVVPFGGGREEWPALELAAWIARAHRLPLKLVGVEASSAQRDASRTLAAASLALQRFAEVAAELAVVPAGVEALLAQDGSLLVGSLPTAELDPTRRALLERARIPVLLVHGGLRPSGLAPDRTLTRFSWSAAPG
jgi:DNA-binding SARP family transcriptional activator